MGNRAVLTMDHKIGIYLHWNGGRDSVEAFIKYCELRQFRGNYDPNYGMARLAQVISNFMGGDVSIGIGRYEELDCDNYDNGVYVIVNWKIIRREHFKGTEQNEYDILDLIKYIDLKQPQSDRIFTGKRKLTLDDIKTKEEGRNN